MGLFIVCYYWSILGVQRGCRKTHNVPDTCTRTLISQTLILMPHRVVCCAEGFLRCADTKGNGVLNNTTVGSKFRIAPLWLMASLAAGIIGLGCRVPAAGQPAYVCQNCRKEASKLRGKFKQTENQILVNSKI